MRVKLMGDLSGDRNGVPWPRRGAEIDLPDDEGAALCAQGMAEPVAKKDTDKVEKAVMPEAEIREGPLTTEPGPAKRGPGRPRKSE